MRDEVQVKRFNTELTEASTPFEAQDKQRVRRRMSLCAIAALTCLPAWLHAQSAGSTSTASKSTAAAAPTALQKNVEAYLRNLYALGPGVQLTVSAPKDSEVPGL